MTPKGVVLGQKAAKTGPARRGSPGVLLRISCTRGRQLGCFSIFPEELEVIIAPSERFRLGCVRWPWVPDLSRPGAHPNLPPPARPLTPPHPRHPPHGARPELQATSFRGLHAAVSAQSILPKVRRDDGAGVDAMRRWLVRGGVPPAGLGESARERGALRGVRVGSF